MWLPELKKCGDFEANPGPDLSKISLVMFAEKLCDTYVVGLNLEFIARSTMGLLARQLLEG